MVFFTPAPQKAICPFSFIHHKPFNSHHSWTPQLSSSFSYFPILSVISECVLSIVFWSLQHRIYTHCLKRTVIWLKKWLTLTHFTVFILARVVVDQKPFLGTRRDKSRQMGHQPITGLNIYIYTLSCTYSYLVAIYANPIWGNWGTQWRPVSLETRIKVTYNRYKFISFTISKAHGWNLFHSDINVCV